MPSNPVMQHGQRVAQIGRLSTTLEESSAANETAMAPGLGLEISPDAMFCLTTGGIVCEVNDRAANLLGYHAQLMSGAHVGAFISRGAEADSNSADAGSADSGLGDLLQALLAGDGRAIEATAHTLSGQNLPIEITTLRHRQNGQDYLVCAMRDISHRKQHEHVLAEAKEIAERANVAKLEFLSQLSHELRTPLAAIIGFGEVMRDEMFGPLGVRLYQTYAADICQSGRQLTDVVERIIDVARLEGRMATAHARTADLGEMIELVIERAAPEATKQNVRLHNNIRRGSMPVILDDEALAKMIGHVVDNAVTYNRFGGKVEIAAAADQSKDGNLIHLTVTDTGPGMLPDKLAELRRSIDGTKAEASGGLEVCAAFLHLIGGKLDICSAPNLGTTVTLTFPRRCDGRWRP
ncbi:PAS domain-containing sensor histidine kinase [Dongia sp.]|uniref:PAS domain-containing sensor histidine kinase n=1 Tax=Dongia sp. TaxID=1977262 RepID=UPI0035B24DC3